MTVTTANTPTTPLGRPKKRLDTLDVIRGLALCGILFVNLGPILSLYYEPGNTSWKVHVFFDLFVQQRFFPIFSLLFGIGFGMMWNIARARSAKPRLVLTRRVLFLILLGLGHQVLHPGEALLFYGLGGLLLLVPLTWAPVWVSWVLGGLLTVAGAPLSGVALIPGLLVLGFAIGHSGAIWRIDDAARKFWYLLPIFVGASAMGVWLQAQDNINNAMNAIGCVTGVVLAATYIFATAVLMQTPLAGAMTRFFAPLGRMALTNYITATLLALAMVPLIGVLGIVSTDGLKWVPLMAVVILLVQWLWSTLWLKFRKQGPLEQVWRWVTWLQWGATSRSIEAGAETGRQKAVL